MERIRPILAAILECKPEQIDENTSMDNTSGWDSMKHMEIVTALEEELEVPRLSMDEITRMTSVEEIRNVLRNKGVSA
jgi:acyl carrier protein